MGVASGIPRRHNLPDNSLNFWFLQLFYPFFHSVPWASVPSLKSPWPGHLYPAVPSLLFLNPRIPTPTLAMVVFPFQVSAVIPGCVLTSEGTSGVEHAVFVLLGLSYLPQ